MEAELRAVMEAAGKRLGEDGVRDLVRGARAAQGGPEAREGLAEVGRVWQWRARGSRRTRRRRSGRARPSGSGLGFNRDAGWGCDGVALLAKAPVRSPVRQSRCPSCRGKPGVPGQSGLLSVRGRLADGYPAGAKHHLGLLGHVSQLRPHLVKAV